MTVTTFGDACAEVDVNAQSVKSHHSSWTNAKAGSNLAVQPACASCNFPLGFEPAGSTEYLREGFFGFVTSAICCSDSVSAAAIQIRGRNDDTCWACGTCKARAYAFDYGCSIDTTDYRSDTWLNCTGTLLQSSTANMNNWCSSSYECFTVDCATANNAAVNKSGSTRYVLVTDAMTAACQPGGRMEWSVFGTTGGVELGVESPLLTVTHCACAGGVAPQAYHHHARHWRKM